MVTFKELSVFFFFTINALGPIDIVYTWVDGSDPLWLARKEQYLALELSKKNISDEYTQELQQEYRKCLNLKALTVDSATHNRFADHDELRYSLRSVYLNAPFVNHIYIVTMNQIPGWFKPHPKVTFVNHADIFPNSADLPTFNSHAIESNLHRIPGLSEYFLYFNDDVFLGNLVIPEDFFTLAGKPLVFFERGMTVSPSATVNATGFRKAWVNTNKYLDAHYKKEKRHRICHAPFALRKSYIEFSEAEFGFIFTNNSAHRFRSAEDYNVTNGLVQYHWLYHNKIEPLWNYPRNIVELGTDAMLSKTTQALEKLYQDLVPFFCLEDGMTENSTETRIALHEFFEKYYPVPAPWEK